MGIIPSRFDDNDDKRVRRKGLRRAGNDFPAGPVAGDMFYELDTKMLWIWNGTAWKMVFNAT